jgi:hypothetical protein
MSDIVNSITPTLSHATNHDTDYQSFESLIAERVAAARGPLFTTDATGLWEAYLAGIPGETKQVVEGTESGEMLWLLTRNDIHYGPRQYYCCRHCRQFIERYGGLVNIQDDGRITSPIFWDLSEVGPEFFHQSIRNIDPILTRAKVTGVFVNGEATWGMSSNVAGKGSKCEGTRWTHLHGCPTLAINGGSNIMNAEQRMAEYKQNFGTLKHDLADYPLEACVQAVCVLESDEVDRAEKTLGLAKWLVDLHQRLANIGLRGNKLTRPQYDNLIWLAVATAPPGWCHVRSTIISTLLDDIKSGLGFNEIKRRWDAKMHPLRYQRPQTVPSDGQITAANKLMEKLRAEGVLDRRYARLDEVTALWKYNAGLQEALARDEALRQDKMKGGAFDHLRTKQQGCKTVELPPKPMTWEKFRTDVLLSIPHISVGPIRSIEVLLSNQSMPFFGMTTVVNPDSPPVLQWDGLVVGLREGVGNRDDRQPIPRNPVAWYFYHGGSRPQEWGLKDNAYGVYGRHWWQKVDAICLKPCHWQRHMDHQSDDVFFIISTARDQREANVGYFPEMLRSEWHGIRAVIEAHSLSSKLAGKEDGTANGVALCKGQTLTVRVDGDDSYVLSL